MVITAPTGGATSIEWDTPAGELSGTATLISPDEYVKVGVADGLELGMRLGISDGLELGSRLGFSDG